jgi:hypothetical protein
MTADTPPHLRVVLSMREDFLPRLDEVADRIAQILDERCRLTPLSRQAATQALEEPAAVEDLALATHPFQIDGPTKLAILEFLGHRAPIRAGTSRTWIEPFQLQLICERIESAAAAKQKARSASEPVTVTVADIGGPTTTGCARDSLGPRRIPTTPTSMPAAPSPGGSTRGTRSTPSSSRGG